MSKSNLSRDQLASFLKDDRTIRAFEKISQMAIEVLPDELSQLLDLLNGINTFSDPSTTQRINDLAEMINSFQQNYLLVVNSLVQRISVLEEEIQQTPFNQDRFRIRLEAIEALIGI